MALLYGAIVLAGVCSAALMITIIAIACVCWMRQPRPPNLGPVSKTWLNEH